MIRVNQLQDFVRTWGNESVKDEERLRTSKRRVSEFIVIPHVGYDVIWVRFLRIIMPNTFFFVFNYEDPFLIWKKKRETGKIVSSHLDWLSAFQLVGTSPSVLATGRHSAGLAFPGGRFFTGRRAGPPQHPSRGLLVPRPASPPSTLSRKDEGNRRCPGPSKRAWYPPTPPSPRTFLWVSWRGM